MSVARWLETDSLSNQNIASAAAIGAYTADADRMIVVDVSLDQVAGNGDYVVYVTRQINGAGSAYIMLPKTTCTAASGETALAMQSGMISVRSGDVLTVYVDGLAGDTATPDTVVRWFEMATLRPDVADRQVTVAATGEASANVTMQQGVAVAAADANGNVPVVLYGTQGAVEFGQVKITATGNNAAMIIQGAGGGSGVEVISGLTGPYALYLRSQRGHGVYINAGRVGMNISGNDLNDGSSAIDIYNQGWTDADTIRIDNGVALGSALQIRGWGAEPTIKVNSFGAGDAVEITTASGNAMTLNGLIVEDMIAATGIRSAVGMAAANLDTQLGGLATATALATVDGIVDDILEDTGTTLPGLISDLPTASEIDTELSSTHGGGSWEGGGGSYAGDGTGYYTDTIDDGTNPLDGVRVQLYTAQNRVGPAYEAYTNALGVFEMWPDPGTYYRWLDYAGVSFAQDVAVVVTEP